MSSFRATNAKKRATHTFAVWREFGGFCWEVVVYVNGAVFWTQKTPPAYASKSSAERGMNRWIATMREAFS